MQSITHFNFYSGSFNNSFYSAPVLNTRPSYQNPQTNHVPDIQSNTFGFIFDIFNKVQNNK